MPIYEYACERCEHRFEQLVRLNADVPPCPECGEEHVRKLVSQSGFILKGGGWYKDHYGLKSSGGDGGSKKEPAAKPAKKAAESKPAPAKKASE